MKALIDIGGVGTTAIQCGACRFCVVTELGQIGTPQHSHPRLVLVCDLFRQVLADSEVMQVTRLDACRIAESAVTGEEVK